MICLNALGVEVKFGQEDEACRHSGQVDAVDSKCPQHARVQIAASKRWQKVGMRGTPYKG